MTKVKGKSDVDNGVDVVEKVMWITYFCDA